MSKPNPDQKVILWDIDGTLVNSRASRVDKHVKAAEVIVGRDLPCHNRIAGKTDWQILFDLLEANGVTPNRADLTAALGMLDILSIKEISESPVTTIQGAVAALKLVQNLGWINGIVTGNTPVRARAKLQSAGIWRSFDSNFVFYGDRSQNRIELVRMSLITIQAEGDYEVIIIGDTPLDIQSAQQQGVQVVAVATGTYSGKELRDFNPDLLITDWESGCTALEAWLISKRS